MADHDDEINLNSGTLVRDKLWFDDGFTMVPNAWVRDDKLSWAARGILSYLVSHEAGFQLSIEHLVRHSPQGREAVIGTLAELERHGYLKRYRGRERGRFGRIKWHLRDPHTPVNLHGAVQLDLEEMVPLRTKRSWSEPQTGLPSTVKPSTVKPSTVFPDTIEDHLKEHLTQELKTGDGTGAGNEEERSAPDPLDWCPNSPTHTHDRTLGSGFCRWCDLSKDQYFDPRSKEIHWREVDA